MQANMSFSQMSMMNKNISMIQIAQTRLQATNLLLASVQMNYVLSNEEAECGVNPNSEDLGKFIFLLT